MGDSIRRIGVLVWREALALVKWSPSIYLLLVQPLSYSIIFALGMGTSIGTIEYRGTSLTYFAFLFPGILVMQSFDHFSVGLTDSSNERRWGLLKSYFLSRVAPAEYLVSKMLINVVKLVGQTVLVYAVGLALGLLPASLAHPAWLLAFGALASMFWSALGVVMGARVSREEVRSSLLALLTLPVMLTASVFYDISKAPPALRLISSINPLNYQASVMRDLYSGAQVHPLPVALHFALTASAIVLSWWTLSRVDFE